MRKVLKEVSVAVVLVMVLSACNKGKDSLNYSTDLTTTTTDESIVQVTTDEKEDDKKEGIVQPSENAEEYFSGEVRITSYVEPDENGHYVVEESQWTLDEKRKPVDEEVELRKEEFAELGVEVIETSTDTDASASFVFDEENYYKMVAIIENVTNDRTGLYGQCVSISKDFDEVIMYVDENTELTDLVSRVSVLSFSVFQCQTYSGVKASDAHILLKVAHLETEEVLMELTLDMKTSFNISDEEWDALFEE